MTPSKTPDKCGADVVKSLLDVLKSSSEQTTQLIAECSAAALRWLAATNPYNRRLICKRKG
eukprot:4771481-Pleurochrysis_carterae.AAC.1